jgi:hypothetical protein
MHHGYFVTIDFGFETAWNLLGIAHTSNNGRAWVYLA